ncbi:MULTISPECIES: DUF4870 domain-containing protein [unclassified Thermoactinomyces]|uniref:DUF4870 domain-containing protein n=1 Tax=unclassified Thermoactinomyces TaxID=2634588 RepID=UPI0018DBA209|nr:MULTISPECIES: DUF4870 domain-containing protein [unclassified Thermoactinomyces]MBH8596490.1 DUF4870 domain-containing protein [Thermoactinomyces sp. CICC 10523]MBH8603270.1 DUF4870 domain-containing protein [Thermoactinomyces sp. CICC 10522]MBH8608695.1 DUF4870 domain-containing protein [Thermoactinomyces sp. CICC 10521]
MKAGLKILIHASTWFAPVLVPIITWLVVKEHEIRKLSLQALVFHIAMVVLIGLSAVLSFLLIGIPFLIIFGLMALIAPIIGIIRALTDERFDYPIAKWFIR